MYSCVDNIVGEIVEAYEEYILLDALADRVKNYMEQKIKFSVSYSDGLYYIEKI
jgi:hypothetical protein